MSFNVLYVHESCYVHGYLWIPIWKREKKRQAIQNFAWLRIGATFYLDQFVTNSRSCPHKQLVNVTRLNQKCYLVSIFVSYQPRFYTSLLHRCVVKSQKVSCLLLRLLLNIQSKFGWYFLRIAVSIAGFCCCPWISKFFFFGCTSKSIPKFVYIEEKTYKIRSIIKTFVADFRIQINDSLNTDRYLWIAIFQCVSFNSDFSLVVCWKQFLVKTSFIHFKHFYSFIWAFYVWSSQIYEQHAAHNRCYARNDM